MSNYTRLLQHLHRTEHVLPLETIQAALSHYLADTQPAPTPLAATAISSNLFSTTPFNLSNLNALQVAFRHAIHLKYALLNSPKALTSTLFTRSIRSQFNQWVLDLLKGLQGGHAVMRLAAGSGVLLGLEDLKREKKVECGMRGKVEDEVVIAFAEALDLYKHEMGETGPDVSSGAAEWEREFQKHDPSSNDSAIILCLVLACHPLPLIPPNKLQTLPLASVSRILTSCVISAFRQGRFLEDEGQIGGGSHAHAILFNVIAPLSKLASLTLALLIDSRAPDGLSVAVSSLERLCQLCARVETSMHKVLEPSATTDSWQILKTLLFSCVMITEAVLSSSLYIPPSAYSASAGPTSAQADAATPATLAFNTLQVLGHLSYVVHEFGGVTSMGVPTEDGSASGVFKEMRKTFYLALDILSATATREGQTRHLLEGFVNDLCRRVSLHESSLAGGLYLDVLRAEAVSRRYTHNPGPSRYTVFSQKDKLRLSNLSYALACIEQLIPVLSKGCLMGDVWTIVEPHLYLPQGEPETLQSLREPYEAAHSVVLSLFDTSANNHMNLSAPDGSTELSIFAEQLVPFYARCLIENSSDGQLSTVQLCMAFNALLRNASVVDSDATALARDELQTDRPEKYALAWFCISEIVDAQKSLEAELDLAQEAAGGLTADGKLSVALKEEKVHRLRMAMMASLSAVPHALLGEFLAEVKRALGQAEARGAIKSRPQITGKGKEKEQESLEGEYTVDGATAPSFVGSDISKAGRAEKKEELVHALYLEVTERVGDREKELVIGWWYENLDFLGHGLASHKKGEAKSEGLTHRAIAGNETATALARL
ncbi:hypothetical protein V5O48_000877 [Marasmius crinis-equi]|uniref:Uncharacterized protein n=1 Tax=Marasmius crinis-equi TaxID=585013 RepID=A0ABR3G035_9AGAR